MFKNTYRCHSTVCRGVVQVHSAEKQASEWRPRLRRRMYRSISISSRDVQHIPGTLHHHLIHPYGVQERLWPCAWWIYLLDISLAPTIISMNQCPATRRWERSSIHRYNTLQSITRRSAKLTHHYSFSTSIHKQRPCKPSLIAQAVLYTLGKSMQGFYL